MERNTFSNFVSLLLKGLKFDWQYSLVTTLIISGLICTPLILGSIRAGAYRVHVQEAATLHNAREIEVSSRGSRLKFPLDEALGEKISGSLSGTAAVGDWDVRLRVQGPKGRYADDGQAIWPRDPRIDVFGIEVNRPSLALREVVLSDIGGNRLFGEKAWRDHWSKDGQFNGPPVSLDYVDGSHLGDFNVVGRTAYRTRDIFISPELARELRRYSDGEGSKILKLRATDIASALLPPLSVSACAIMVEYSAQCGPDQFDKFKRLASESDYEIDSKSLHGMLPVERYGFGTVTFYEGSLDVGSAKRAVKHSCDDVLRPKSVNSCPNIAFNPVIAVSAKLSKDNVGSKQVPVTLAAMAPQFEAAYISDGFFAERAGDAVAISKSSILEKKIIDAIISDQVATGLGVSIGQDIFLLVGETELPLRVRAIYKCQSICAQIFTDPVSAFRVQNLAEKTIEVVNSSPITFRNVRTSEQFDRILVYAKDVENVVSTASGIKRLLGDEGYGIEYNRRTLLNIERDDIRLATLFQATVIFAIVFLLLALAALSKINVDRRRRQIAQLIILGFSYLFVRALVVVEYLLLAVIASAVSLIISIGLSWGLRTLLLSANSDGSSITADRSYARVVNAMTVDMMIFSQILATVVFCSLVVSLVVAYVLSRSDPLELLE